MILLWLLYGIVVGALFATAAWLLERALRLHARPTRWVWATALIATAALTGSAPLRDDSAGSLLSLPAALEAQFDPPGASGPAHLVSVRLVALFAALTPTEASLRQWKESLPRDWARRVNRGAASDGWRHPQCSCSSSS